MSSVQELRSEHKFVETGVTFAEVQVGQTAARQIRFGAFRFSSFANLRLELLKAIRSDSRKQRLPCGEMPIRRGLRDS